MTIKSDTNTRNSFTSVVTFILQRVCDSVYRNPLIVYEVLGSIIFVSYFTLCFVSSFLQSLGVQMGAPIR